MIASEKDYCDAMREMIRKVQQGYEPPFEAEIDEMEIFADCIREGYLIGETTYIDSRGVVQEHRTMDGKMHPILYNHVVTPKGLAFLSSAIEQNSTDGKEKKNCAAEKKLEIIKQVFKRFWALFCGIGAIVTVFGWTEIRRFFAFLLSFFQ